MTSKYLFDEEKFDSCLANVKINFVYKFEEKLATFNISNTEIIKDFINASIVEAVKDFAEKVRPEQVPGFTVSWNECVEQVNDRITAALSELTERATKGG